MRRSSGFVVQMQLSTSMCSCSREAAADRIFTNERGCVYSKTVFLKSMAYEHNLIHSSIVHSSQEVGNITSALSRWMDRLKAILCRIGILFTCEKEWNFDICYNTVDLENMLSEASQVQMDKVNIWAHLGKLSGVGKSAEIRKYTRGYHWLRGRRVVG